MGASQETIYCPVCSTGRDVPKMALPLWRMLGLGVLWGLLVGVLFGLLIGPLAGFWAGFVVALLSLLGFEVYYGFKYKKELACPVCRFDPILYRKAPEEAKQLCRRNIEGKQRDFLEKWQALRQKDTEAVRG